MKLLDERHAERRLASRRRCCLRQQGFSMLRRPASHEQKTPDSMTLNSDAPEKFDEVMSCE
jgi:Holliday junction resolvase